jgi:hypothetical protein
MSKKVAQNTAQLFFVKIDAKNLTMEAIRSPEMSAISVIFNKLPKVNDPPLGENLPNLVTLDKLCTY